MAYLSSNTNTGKEPHFAGFTKVAPGKTFADVKAALTTPPTAAPPQGPSPFEDFGGIPTTDPGGTGNMTVNLPVGTYALFCTIPSPDGTAHAAKGMITRVTVTEGNKGNLPASVGTVVAADFSLDQVPGRAGRLRAAYHEGHVHQVVHGVRLAPACQR